MKFGLICVLVLCLGAAQVDAACTTLYGRLAKQDTETMVQMIDALGARPIFDQKRYNVTCFAPTDLAFDAYFAKIGTTREAFLQNTALVEKFLFSHIIGPEATVTIKSVKGLGTYNTAQSPYTLTIKPGAISKVLYGPYTVVNSKNLKFSGAAVVINPDITACDATVHVVSQVLAPM